jgi:hypothetical protein
MKQTAQGLVASLVVMMFGGSLVAVSTQAPPQPSDYKLIAAQRLSALGQCNQNLGALQGIGAQVEAGILVNASQVDEARTLAIKQTEERIATMFEKNYPGQTFNVKAATYAAKGGSQ